MWLITFFTRLVLCITDPGEPSSLCLLWLSSLSVKWKLTLVRILPSDFSLWLPFAVINSVGELILRLLGTFKFNFGSSLISLSCKKIRHYLYLMNPLLFISPLLLLRAPLVSFIFETFDKAKPTINWVESPLHFPPFLYLISWEMTLSETISGFLRIKSNLRRSCV